MYAGPCELNAPTSGTRDRRLRGYLVSFARCPRVETDLAAAVLPYNFEFRSIDFLYNFPCQSIRLTQTESQRPPGLAVSDSTRICAQSKLGPHYTIFFKQKTAYGIMSGDWSSDVCSSD
eukprot:COSAG02_NODE_40465_length_405_cov_0.869281_1_plen_118_part_01